MGYCSSNNCQYDYLFHDFTIFLYNVLLLAYRDAAYARDVGLSIRNAWALPYNCITSIYGLRNCTLTTSGFLPCQVHSGKQYYLACRT